MKLKCSICTLLIVVIKNVLLMDVEKLKFILQAPIFPYWPVQKNFSNFNTLKIDEESLKLGVEYSGSLTSKAIQNLMNKVLNGENITMLVYGGSSTRGADLGPQSNDWTFHHIVRTWWNNAIAPITGSYMKREVIAVGGVGSTYFGHCWKEYLSKNAYIDLLVWEFFINDPDSQDYGKGVEKFIRTVLSYYSQPALIFTKFYSKCPIAFEPPPSCLQHNVKQDDLLAQLAKVYGFTSLNLFHTSYDYIHRVKRLKVKELFVGSDVSHPSHLAHAQMAYLIIYYLQKQISIDLTVRTDVASFFKFNKDNLGYLTSRQLITDPPLPVLPTIPDLPQAVFNTIDVNSTCWSAILPDDRFLMPHSLFSLHVEYKIGFAKHLKQDWDLNVAMRRDVRGGYRALHANAFIRIAFPIDYTAKGHVYISISHVITGGETVVQVNSHHGFFQTFNVDCSRRIHKAQHVYYVGTFPPGESKLTMETVGGGCEINSIIVE